MIQFALFCLFVYLYVLVYKPEVSGSDSRRGHWFPPPHSVHNTSSHTMARALIQPVNEYQKSSWMIKRGWRARLRTSPLSVNRFSRIFGILDVLQLYKSPRPVTGIALLFFSFFFFFFSFFPFCSFGCSAVK
jgi:hypothetical protein